MIVVKLRDALGTRRSEMIEAIKGGKLFVYPTDTIYGIGCNAQSDDSVKKIAAAKSRDEGKPMSVIAPSIDWIEQNTAATPQNMVFVKSLLPGPYTVILKAKPNAPKSVVSVDKTIGVRIPFGDFTKLVRDAGVPFVTTSVNISGEEPVKRIADIPDQIKAAVDIAIDDGEIDGLPSRIFDLSGKELRIARY
jgi:L-threonylcarbamoyladenylate synthase